MLKNIIYVALMIAMLLLPAGLAESAAVTNFTFMDTITWASTPEEVTEVLGEGVQRVEETDKSIGTVAMLWTENGSFAGHKSSKIAFTYYNHALSYIACYYTETDITDIQLLIDEMTKLYGDPKLLNENKMLLIDFFNGTKAKCEWNIGDDTKIEVVELDAQSSFPTQEEEYPYQYIVTFTNLPVYKLMEEAVNVWMADSTVTSLKINHHATKTIASGNSTSNHFAGANLMVNLGTYDASATSILSRLKDSTVGIGVDIAIIQTGDSDPIADIIMILLRNDTDIVLGEDPNTKVVVSEPIWITSGDSDGYVVCMPERDVEIHLTDSDGWLTETIESVEIE